MRCKRCVYSLLPPVSLIDGCFKIQEIARLERERTDLEKAKVSELHELREEKDAAVGKLKEVCDIFWFNSL